MDTDNPVVQLCLKGTRLEFEKKPDEARRFYQRAWDIARDDFEACIAAHYLARQQATLEDALQWNQESLRRADLVGDERVEAFYPSLYVSLARAYELLGDRVHAEHFYGLAAASGLVHRGDGGSYPPIEIGS